jgi:hypothetical protein
MSLQSSCPLIAIFYCLMRWLETLKLLALIKQIQGKLPTARYVRRYIRDSISSLLLSSAIGQSLLTLTKTEEGVHTRKHNIPCEGHILLERDMTSIALFVFLGNPKIY